MKEGGGGRAALLRRHHLQPLIKRLGAVGFDEPDAAVVALDVRAAGVGAAEAAAGDGEVVEPEEHGFLDVGDGKPLNRRAPEVVDASDVVKFCGQVQEVPVIVEQEVRRIHKGTGLLP
ncbi:hypothetical protein U1Q18_030640 [Sarracenia purpurea var. burkii]